MKRGDIKKPVMDIVHAISQDLKAFSEASDLRDDLKLNEDEIAILSVPFIKLARNYKKDAVVTADECVAQKTVGNCIDLVYSKIA